MIPNLLEQVLGSHLFNWGPKLILSRGDAELDSLGPKTYTVTGPTPDGLVVGDCSLVLEFGLGSSVSTLQCTHISTEWWPATTELEPCNYCPIL